MSEATPSCGPVFSSGVLSGLKFRKKTTQTNDDEAISDALPSRKPTFRSGFGFAVRRGENAVIHNEGGGTTPPALPLPMLPFEESGRQPVTPGLNPLEELVLAGRPTLGTGRLGAPVDTSAASPVIHPQRTSQGFCPITVFKRNRFGSPPVVCGPWDGRVASRGIFDGFVLTSPSQDHVPKMPKDADVIQTYMDGRWGVHEYSRHPQWYISDKMAHMACIPRTASPPDIPSILFTNLEGNAHWEEDRSVVVHGLGRMRDSVRDELAEAATTLIQRTEAIVDISDGDREYAQFLCMLLRQVVDRMNYLPSVATRAVAIAAHVQRLCLELAGLHTYLTVVVGRIRSPKDFSGSVLDVVGAFVRDGGIAQLWHRVGVPYWLLQALKDDLAVWRIVDEDALPYDLSTRLCDPPILHQSGAFLGVSTLTGNWVSSMLVSVSKHIAGSHLSSLAFSPSFLDGPAEPQPNRKRPRLEERPLISSHLSMREAVAGKGPKAGASQAPRKDAATSPTEHPSRSLVLSPFVDIPLVWEQALRSIGPLPQTPDSALYFFPPPFLLDTVPSKDSIPPGCIHPDRIRSDAKVYRYLHNLIRIREFCRARLFDISLENRPLTVREWRAALWGDYTPQTSVLAGDRTSGARRAKRRTGERNDMVKLFHHIAHMNSYSANMIVEFEGVSVDQANLMNNAAIRASLLWESHEVNFRAELLALDSLLVPSRNWMEIHRWEREMKVSGVWGTPSSAATVAASTHQRSRVFCWHSPPHNQWETCRERLRAFAQVLTRWPGCPELVVQGGIADLEMGIYRDVQQSAVSFYVQTFVSRYARLPIPPVVSS